MQPYETLEVSNISTEKTVSNFTQVVAILPKEKAIDIIKSAIPPGGHKHVYINARGTLYKDKWYQKLRPSVSPEQVIVETLLPDNLAEQVIENLCVAGNLNSSGTGILYSIACKQVLFFSEHNNNKEERYVRSDSENQYKKNAQKIIFCIIQNNKAEDVAIAAIRAGAHGPTITYGQGRGIRERMGLIRIAISPEKAFIRVVVDDYNAESVFEAMVTEGKIHTPGMGFIYLMPLNNVLVNVASVALGKNNLAHQYQIIKAIDELKGGSNWRTFGVSTVKVARKSLYNLSRLSCVISRGKSQQLIQAAMDAGATGASINYGIEGEAEINVETRIQVNKEVEISEITVSEDIIDKVLEAMISTIRENSFSCYIYVQDVNKALTYLE